MDHNTVFLIDEVRRKAGDSPNGEPQQSPITVDNTGCSAHYFTYSLKGKYIP